MALQMKFTDRTWTISQGLSDVGEIHMDPWDQVEEVVLDARSSADTQLKVLRLAANHAHVFVRHRRVGGDIISADVRNDQLTAHDSYTTMMRGHEHILAPIQQLDRDGLIKALSVYDIDIVDAIYRSAGEAIRASVLAVGIKSLRCRILPEPTIFANQVVMEFAVQQPHYFRFWKSESVPASTYENIYVVPAYHPVMNGWESVGLVNGHTDAYCSGNAVHSIFCPREARSETGGRDYGASWEHVTHPFVAQGQSIRLCLVTTKMRSAEGVNELTDLLEASLGQKKRYVSISGGFRAPMVCGRNRLVELERRSPWPKADYSRRIGNVTRGSEEHCVWAYRTLKAEGALPTAYVPQWLLDEGWLEIYKDAEVRPGLF